MEIANGMEVNYMNYLKGKILLLNSPPDSGKDTIADYLCCSMGEDNDAPYEGTLSLFKGEFKKRLFLIAMTITGLTNHQFFKIYNNRKLKELPCKEFLGMSPREMLIWISETVCKPKFGKEYFGDSAARDVSGRISEGWVFSDSGFPEEVIPLVREFGAENILIQRFSRDGKDFSNDSRDYLKEEDLPEGVIFLPDLENNGTIEEICNKILNNVKEATNAKTTN